ncbi:MAG: pyrimidine dimer DNA glycosylase/endonuclease V [Alphaproteobacteria bacterium]|nr:pyrimidine dimer DNA glycosylase/endonuclease V [Alphaproteobacteria bacterium]MBN2675207.1 pyrimidine dimer DNA glycosylase/endonuclease V [Alphaproteobacteria bacterium]
MTRINLIPVSELSDQHLMAEYRELPRIINGVLMGKFNRTNIPKKYVLGAGHIKFFTNKLIFLQKRYEEIYTELVYRKFKLNSKYNPNNLLAKILEANTLDEKYSFSDDEIALSKQRIIEKVQKKPLWYKWTGRRKPDYL